MSTGSLLASFQAIFQPNNAPQFVQCLQLQAHITPVLR
jgi:hypothetical protein